MSGCGCDATEADTVGQRRILWIALALNAAMFVLGSIAGVLAQSSGLLADALDMLADAIAYGVAIAAVRRDPMFKARAAALSGSILLVLGLGILADAFRRGLTGSEPESVVMIAIACLSLTVNATVLRMLGKVRGQGTHLNATWIFTRADVIANLAVIASGVIVGLTGARFLDLLVGAGIGVYVLKEAFEILRDARAARSQASA